MKRRSAIQLLPFSIAGITGLTKHAFSEEKTLSIVRSRRQEPLAIQYSKKVRERLTWIRENQSENLMEASYAIARTVQNGGRCYQSGWDAGHTEADSWPGRNGEPEIFSTSFNIKEAKEGDLLLASSQTLYNEKNAKKKIFII
ncbi:MAG TPA: hypothetical protein VMZ04_09180, partial [Anaerolineae bacterium]|nr:hypothetical protein [Anaerolineae bacterium]